MIDAEGLQSLLTAVHRYLDLMYDSDVSHFDEVFASSAQLHGLRDGDIRTLHAHAYKLTLESRPSPKSRGAPREQDILLVDFASETQALVKVRVRINALQYCDYLSYHRAGTNWLITAKSFHIERQLEPAASQAR